MQGALDTRAKLASPARKEDEERDEKSSQKLIGRLDRPHQQLFQQHRSKADGRSVSLRLTNKGKKALARDPFEVLVRAVDALDANERTEMHHTVHKVLTTVTASGAHRRFGVCQDCTYLGGEMCSNLTSASPSALKCLLFGVPIEPADAGLLCVHFQPMNEHRDGAHGK
jgi:hypothetical protein